MCETLSTMKILLVYFLIWRLAYGQQLNTRQLLVGSSDNPSVINTFASDKLLPDWESFESLPSNVFEKSQAENNYDLRPAEFQAQSLARAIGNGKFSTMANDNAAEQLLDLTDFDPKERGEIFINTRPSMETITHYSSGAQTATSAESNMENFELPKRKSSLKNYSSSSAQSGGFTSPMAFNDLKASTDAESYSDTEFSARTSSSTDQIPSRIIANAEAEARAAAQVAVAAQEEAETQAKAAARAEAEANTATAAEARAEAKAQAETAARVQAEARADASALAEAKAKAEVSVKAKAKARAEADARAEAEARAQAEARAAASAQAEARARAQVKAEAEVSARAEAIARTEAKARAKAEKRAEASARAEAQAKAEAAVHAKAAETAKLDAEIKTVTEAYANAVAKAEASAKKATIASTATTNAAQAIKKAALAQAQAAFKASIAEEAAAAAAVATSEANIAAAAVQSALMLSLMIAQSADLTQKMAISYAYDFVKAATASKAAIELVKTKAIKAEELVALAIAAAKKAASKHAVSNQKIKEALMHQEIAKETSIKADVMQLVALEYARLFSLEAEEVAETAVSASAIQDSKIAKFESAVAARATPLNAVRDGIVTGLGEIIDKKHRNKSKS